MDNQQKPFDKEVDRILGLMSEMDPSHDDYTRTAESLKTVCEARAKKPGFPVDPEVLITATVNLIGIMLILQHERLHVVTSRAISFVRK
jgi:hypothetical protein